MQSHTEFLEHDKNCDFYAQQETNIAQTSFMEVYRKQGGSGGQVPCTLVCIVIHTSLKKVGVEIYTGLQAVYRRAASQDLVCDTTLRFLACTILYGVNKASLLYSQVLRHTNHCMILYW